MSLFKNDKLMSSLYTRVTKELAPITNITKSIPDKYFNDLSSSIIGQQLSNVVADIIELRVKNLVGADKVIYPAQLLTTNIEALRVAGLSYSKISYLKNLAELWSNGSIKHELFDTLPDQEIIDELVKVKGIGKWTAEMFLIFSLDRKDVFSAGDLILKRKTIEYYKLADNINLKDLEIFALRWSPERTLASRTLWASMKLSSDSK